MALSSSTRVGIALSVFGASLILASGPGGLAFGAALLTSLAIVATVAAVASLSPRTHFGFWPVFGLGGIFHRPWFHSRTFVPGGVHNSPSRSFFGGPSRSTTFHAAPSFTPSYRAPSTGGFFSGFGGATHMGRSFVPGGLRR